MQWKPWAIIFVDTRYNSLSTIPHKINRSSGITDFIFVCLGVSKTFGFLPIFALPDLNSSHCFRLAARQQCCDVEGGRVSPNWAQSIVLSSAQALRHSRAPCSEYFAVFSSDY